METMFVLRVGTPTLNVAVLMCAARLEDVAWPYQSVPSITRFFIASESTHDSFLFITTFEFASSVDEGKVGRRCHSWYVPRFVSPS